MKRGEAVEEIMQAVTPYDLFPFDATEEDAQAIYRRLARHVHPDRNHAALATEAFVRLQNHWAAWQRHAAGEQTIKGRKYAYEVNGLIATGDIANLYTATYEHDATIDPAFVKVPRSPKDNDLMEREARALKALHKGDEKWWPFVPQLVETFRLRDTATRVVRRVNALERRRERFYSLEDVRKVYGDLDPKDAAWMWRRLLVAIGYANDCGVVHGAIVPKHVLIQPEKHGLILWDWCYSTTPDGKVPALAVDRTSSIRAQFYAPEILNKEVVDGTTDIYMATRCMEYLMGNRAPKPLRAFIRGCTLESRSGRPQDVWKLRAEFDELIERMWGVRRFRVFTMPP